ncbi:MAG: 4-carboxy-4-hydroxy-2-oxoadipate aldolase/oxaloacetate decarboxylase [Rhodovibrionaceae bacterium]
MIEPVVYKSIPAVDPALVARAAEIGVADLHEGLGVVAGRMALMSPRMRPLNRGLCVAGQAVTAFNYPGDNLMLHMALRLAEKGQILVLTNGGGEQGALWGEMAATYAMKKGVGGIVVHGAIRDVDALSKMGSPVWSTAISPTHPDKKSAGAVNVPIVCDGVLVNPGDVIVADGDGVISVPRDLLATAVENAAKRAAREVEIRGELAQGKHLFDVMGMQKSFDSLGIEIREGAWGED